MKAPKEKFKVNIVCTDGTFVKGYLHVNQGQRILDYLNNSKGDFVVITGAEFSNIKEIHSFKLYADFRKKKGLVVLNKTAIKWIGEVK